MDQVATIRVSTVTSSLSSKPQLFSLFAFCLVSSSTKYATRSRQAKLESVLTGDHREATGESDIFPELESHLSHDRMSEVLLHS